MRCSLLQRRAQKKRKGKWLKFAVLVSAAYAGIAAASSKNIANDKRCRQFAEMKRYYAISNSRPLYSDYKPVYWKIEKERFDSMSRYGKYVELQNKQSIVRNAYGAKGPEECLKALNFSKQLESDKRVKKKTEKRDYVRFPNLPKNLWNGIVAFLTVFVVSKLFRPNT